MYKKLVFVLMVLMIMGLAVPLSAVDYYLPGEWNGWNPAADQMTDLGGGIYSKTMTGLTPNARYEFKVNEGGDWANPSYPPSNCWVFADENGEVTVTFNTNVVSDGWSPDQYRISLSTEPGDWTIAGSFGGVGYPDWDPAGAGMQMTHLGGGIYRLTLYLPTGGGPDWIGDPTNNTYAWKAVRTGTWDSISVDGRGINTANAVVTVSEGLEYVNFYVDAYNNVVRTEVVPEPTTIALLGIGGLALLRRKH